MDIFGMGTRHGLSNFEQIAVLGVVDNSLCEPALCLAVARQCPEERQRHEENAGGLGHDPHWR